MNVLRSLFSKDIEIKRISIEITVILIISNIFRVLFNYTIEHLDQSIYFSFSFFLSSFENIFFVIFFVTTNIFLIYNYANTSWHQFSDYKILRVLLYAIIFPIFWEQFFYDYNFYLNTDALIDKGLLLLFMVLIYIHPLFSLMILFLGYIFFNSIALPFDSAGAHIPEFSAIYHMLILFIGFLLVKSTKQFKNIDTKLFVFLALTLHASNYFISGIAKIEISPNGLDWIFSNEINNLFISAYLKGWLGFLDKETSLLIAQYIDNIDIIFTFSNMLIQVGAIFLLYQKRVSLLMFISFEFFHIGIALISGIFFWQWIVMNFGFIYTVQHLSKENLDFLYNKKMFMTFILIVLLSPLIYRPFVFAWWDSNLNTVYDIYAITNDNKSIKLNSQDLAPYDELFAQNSIGFIDREVSLLNNRGFLLKDINLYSNGFFKLLIYLGYHNPPLDTKKSINKSFIIYDALEKAKNIADIEAVLVKYGDSIYSEKKRRNFKIFLQKYFKNYNRKGKEYPFYKKFGAPYMLYDFTPLGLLNTPQIDYIEVYKTNIWYDKRERAIKHFAHKRIMIVPIK